MKNITIEISSTFRESLDLLKEILVWEDEKPLKNDTEVVESLIAWFLGMLQTQSHHHDENCNHDH